jgi:hypothetical protein
VLLVGFLHAFAEALEEAFSDLVGDCMHVLAFAGFFD